ncbi:MAG: M23 family metallopeptidase [Nanoarchaeota archaeon]
MNKKGAFGPAPDTLIFVSGIGLVAIIIISLLIVEFPEEQVKHKITELSVNEGPNFLMLGILRTPVTIDGIDINIGEFISLWCHDPKYHNKYLEKNITSILNKIYSDAAWVLKCKDKQLSNKFSGNLNAYQNSMLEINTTIPLYDNSVTTITLLIDTKGITSTPDSATNSDPQNSISVTNEKPPGNLPKTISLSWPLDQKYKIITSGFGYRGKIAFGSDCHGAIDIGAPVGEPVKAAASGIVAATSTQSVTLRHKDNYLTRYYHINPIVRTGDTISVGQVIGKIAPWDGGAHVHLELVINNYDTSNLGPNDICIPEPTSPVYNAIIVKGIDGIGHTDAPHLNPLCFMQTPSGSYCSSSLACKPETGGLNKGCSQYKIT